MTVTKELLTQIALRMMGGDNKLGRDLLSEGWTFSFGDMSAIGDCWYNRKELRLSQQYITARTLEEHINTITHEMAHAITYTDYGQTGHGARWKSVHISLGGDGSRTSRVENKEAIRSKYIVYLEGTLEVVRNLNRMDRRYKRGSIESLYLTNRKEETLGKLKVATYDVYQELKRKKLAEENRVAETKKGTVTMTGSKRQSVMASRGAKYVCGDFGVFPSMKAAATAITDAGTKMSKNAIGNRCNPKFYPLTFKKHPDWYMVFEDGTNNKDGSIR